MPIYEYRCTQCGHEHDALQKFSDAPLTTCPSCHKEALVKQLSAAGFQLKGSGWYATDFRSKGGSGKPAPGGDGAKADASSAGGETKGEAAASESKTATKTATKSDSSSTDSSSGSSAKSCSPGCGCH